MNESKTETAPQPGAGGEDTTAPQPHHWFHAGLALRTGRAVTEEHQVSDLKRITVEGEAVLVGMVGNDKGTHYYGARLWDLDGKPCGGDWGTLTNDPEDAEAAQQFAANEPKSIRQERALSRNPFAATA